MTGPEPTSAWDRLNADGLAFLHERHLAVLSTLGTGGRIHAVPVGFTVDQGLIRVITSVSSQKVRNVQRDPTCSLTQVDGRRWITVQGDAEVVSGAGDVAAAEALYEARYRRPRPNPERVVLLVRATRILADSTLRAF